MGSSDRKKSSSFGSFSVNCDNVMTSVGARLDTLKIATSTKYFKYEYLH